MEHADGGVQNGRLDHGRPADRQDVPDEHVLQVLGAFGRFAHRKNRSGGRDRVNDSDDGFLWDACLVVRARHGKDGGAGEGEGERPVVGDGVVQVVPGEERCRRSEGGDLGEREIDEDHAALHDMETEICVDPRQDQSSDERDGEKQEQVHVTGAPPGGSRRSCRRARRYRPFRSEPLRLMDRARRLSRPCAPPPLAVSCGRSTAPSRRP